MSSSRNTEPGAVCLFKYKSGAVTAEIWGPRIGTYWRDVCYFHWRPSTREPGKFEQVYKFKPKHQPHLRNCMRQVDAWLKRDEQERIRSRQRFAVRC